MQMDSCIIQVEEKNNTLQYICFKFNESINFKIGKKFVSKIVYSYI